MKPDFLAVFFKRAADTVRRQFGEDAYIDASGEDIRIRGKGGELLGRGETLQEAISVAARYESNVAVLRG